MASSSIDVGKHLDHLSNELRLIRKRLEAIEDILAEELSQDDKVALKEALKEHRKGKTISLDEAKRKLS